ncbi:phosphatase 2C-like domain-containing protein [Myxozyma melibiosi]|uniref:Phosphatase 2C-like domain-containing protein n=1 Tax=Myxozyma melibiosi TaxID=54550 RepID=A0ABR1F2M8_9ASCO
MLAAKQQRQRWTIADSYKFISSFRRPFTTYYTTTSSSSPSPPSTTTSSPSPPPPRLRIPLLNAPTHLGHLSSRSNRLYNEDRYCVGVLTVPANSTLTPRRFKDSDNPTRQVFYYGVFDGHGGAQCSEFLAQNLASYIETVNINSGEDLEQEWRENVGGYWARWKGHFEKYKRQLTSDSDLLLRVPLAFLQADLDFINSTRPSGSTCTTAMIYNSNPAIPYFAGGESHLLIAHVGDTRCVISDARGLAIPLTATHHLSSPIESNRLRRYSASFFTDSFGEERFGNVENTRSFGDLPMKRLGVSAEPDMSSYTLNSKTSDSGFGGSEPFLALVSDGVSKFVSDQEIVDIITSIGYRSGSGRGTPQDAAREVVNYAEDVGGDDNATCIVVRLAGWGNWMKPVDRTGDLRVYRLKDAMDRSIRGR